MTLAVVMLFLLLYFWRRFFRLALKISAFTAGYNLSGKEAIDLTEACRWEIFLISVLVNGGLLAFFPAVLFDGDGWRAAGAATAAYWVFIHANTALVTSFYQEYTSATPCIRTRIMTERPLCRRYITDDLRTN